MLTTYETNKGSGEPLQSQSHQCLYCSTLKQKRSRRLGSKFISQELHLIAVHAAFGEYSKTSKFRNTRKFEIKYWTQWIQTIEPIYELLF